jgi:transposase
VEYIAELGIIFRYSPTPEIAALAGLAPFSRDSGKLRGSRCIWGGHAQVRRVLYMAAVAGIRSNPFLKLFYLRPRAGGKHAKPALAVCMRKLLVLNAMLRSKIRWQPPALAASIPALSPLRSAQLQHSCC